MTEEIDINGKKYEVHTNTDGDCGHSQGKQCVVLKTDPTIVTLFL